MKEIWKDVVGYEGLYQISSLGRVRRVGGKILKPTRFSKGYFHVNLCCNGNYIDEFQSISDAQKKTQCWNISRICRGLSPQNGDYVWLYLKDYKQ